LNVKPATLWRPPPDEFNYVPKGSIDLNTTQKTNYKPFETFPERVKPFKAIETLQLPTDPFNAISAYQREFIPKENDGLSSIVKRNSNESTLVFFTYV
jgi:hypothetical protein